MKIEPKKLNIKNAFKNYYYIVPAYQREYIWKKEHVIQLFDDIYEEYSERGKDSEYFIGSIVVSIEKNGFYEIIDGQQRLTTLFLSLCAFRKIFLKTNNNKADNIKRNFLLSSDIDLNGKDINKIKLELQYKDNNKILKKILDDNQEKSTSSNSNIEGAYLIIKEYFNNKFTKEEIEKFSGYFMNNINFMQLEAPSTGDALKIFETVNDRGVGLSPMDLLKNLIFQQLESDEFDELSNEWKKIIDKLSNKKNNKKRKAKPMRFLKYFIMANYKVKDDPKSSDVIREDEIYKWINRHDKECKFKNTPFEFVKKIEENVDSYNSYLNTNTSNNEINIALKNIEYLGGTSFSQHLVILLAGRKLRDNLFLHLVKQIEKLIFYYFVTKTQAKYLEARFSKWADELQNVVNSENEEESLNKFIENSFTVEQNRLKKDFENMFLELRINSLQKYKIKYILAKIAQYVEMERIGQKKEIGLDEYLKKEIEIEHIIPNNPKIDLIDDFGGEEKYNLFKEKLGNLTLLEKPHNIIAGRSYFDDKKRVYKESSIYLTKSIVRKENIGLNSSVEKINDKLISFNEWTDESIDERQKMLYKLACKIWDIQSSGYNRSEFQSLDSSYSKKDDQAILEKIIVDKHSKNYNIGKGLLINNNLENQNDFCILKFQGESYSLKNKKDVLLKFCEIVNMKVDNFDKVLEINGGRVWYFSKDERKKNNGGELQRPKLINGTIFYVNTCFSGDNIKKACNLVADKFGLERPKIIY